MRHERIVRVRVQGKVQGVWYRAWTQEEARELGIDGWVRNRKDGSVEAVFAGRADDVTNMLELCRSGPPLARVTGVEAVPEDTVPSPGFEQRPTV
jgi:acylphosphatase